MFLRWLVGKPISWLIMPSQLSHKDNQDYAHLRKNRIQEGIKITSGTVPSSKGALISYSELGKDKQPSPNEKIIIFAVGNNDFYENHINDYIDWAKRYPEYRIVGFNFRGTLASKGSVYSEDHWIDDACAIVEHFRSQGVPIENILLNGHSMGAALLTMAAAKIYKSDCEKAKKNNTLHLVKSLKLMNNRSFSNLADELLISILGKFGCALIASIISASLILCFLGLSLISLGLATILSGVFFVVRESVVQTLLKPLLEVLVWLCFGRLDAASAYKSLPQDCVDHIFAENDRIIKKGASLHRALKSDNARIKWDLKQLIVYGNENEKKNAWEKLRHMKDCKLRSYFPGNNDAHNADLGMLTTYHDLRKNPKDNTLAKQLFGSQVMEEKVQRLLKNNKP